MKIVYTYPFFVGVAVLDLLVAALALYQGDLGHAVVRLIGGATLLVVIGGLHMSDRNLATSRSLLVDAQAQYALAKAARRTVLMPEISVAPDGHFRGINFPSVEIPSGETAIWAIPRIHGLPPMELRIKRDGSPEDARVRVNWEEGTLDVLDAQGLKHMKLDLNLERENSE
jgi:hypothetical protein